MNLHGIRWLQTAFRLSSLQTFLALEALNDADEFALTMNLFTTRHELDGAATADDWIDQFLLYFLLLLFVAS